jgi:hypothetical protein
MITMTCAEASAILQAPVVDTEQRIRAQSHVFTCAQCGAATDDQLSAMKDKISNHSDGRLVIRTILVIIGIIQLTLALPWIIGVDSWWGHHHDAAEAHLARDGAIALVFTTCAFLAARWRRLAWFCVAPTTLALMVQLAAGIYDDSEGHIGFDFEVIHLIGVAVLFLILLELRPRTRSTRS